MMNGEGEEKKPYDLRERLVLFSLRIIRLSAALPRDFETEIIRKQVVRSGTSPGAQYREACRARSKSEFISKMTCAEQELDETDYWLEILERAELVPAHRLADLRA